MTGVRVGDEVVIERHSLEKKGLMEYVEKKRARVVGCV
jgi:hypothetical protein